MDDGNGFPGRVKTHRRGRIVRNPELNYFFLALVLIIVPSGLFFGFVYALAFIPGRLRPPSFHAAAT